MGAGIYLWPAADAELAHLRAAGLAESVVADRLLVDGQVVAARSHPRPSTPVTIWWDVTPEGRSLLAFNRHVALVRPLDLRRRVLLLRDNRPVDPRGSVGSPGDWFDVSAGDDPATHLVDVYNTEVLSVRVLP